MQSGKTNHLKKTWERSQKKFLTWGLKTDLEVEIELNLGNILGRGKQSKSIAQLNF